MGNQTLEDDEQHGLFAQADDGVGNGNKELMHKMLFALGSKGTA
jgi:hypothetical protein